jgi:glycosyltransferase involved in cell wall biosynthesis
VNWATGQQLRVGLELTGLELSSTGTSRAITGLQAALAELDNVDVEPLSHPSPRVRSGRFTRGLAREVLYFPTQLPYFVRTKKLDVLHCPSQLAPIRSPCPLVITLNDVLAWRQPAALTRRNLLQHKVVLGRALRGAATILTPSRFTRDEILDLLDLDPWRVQVAPYGVPTGFSPGPRPVELLEQLGIFNPYVLAVGASPRKDLATTVAAFEHVVASGTPHRLVIVGALEDDPRLPELIAASPASTRIYLTGRIPDATLLALYQGADCLVHPSRYEGFAFPLLEAMACGLPVIASSRSATGELVGDAGLLVDPEDGRGFARALDRLLGSPRRRADCSRRGLERAAQYSWQACAEITASVYERAAERVSAVAVPQAA